MPPIDPTSHAIGQLTTAVDGMSKRIDKMQATLDGLVATHNQNVGQAKLRSALFGAVGGLGGTILTMVAAQLGIGVPKAH